MRGFDSIADLYERPRACDEARAALRAVSRHDGRFAREEAVRRYGFAVPCVEAVEAVAALSPLLEVGAGSGHWAKLLRAAGADVVATDYRDGCMYGKGWPQEGVEQVDAVEAVLRWPKRNVFVCWPTYGAYWAREMAKRILPGRSLAYIGEWEGCTAEDGFFELMGEGFSKVATMRIPQWDRISDALWILVRK